MRKKITLDDIQIRTTLLSGDIGYLIYLHGDFYSREYGYGLSFESYVASGMHEFYRQYDSKRDCVWVCEHNGKMIGFLLLMHRENNAAQLRYFLILPKYQGIGLGKKLMQLFMDFLKKGNYTSAYLWTTHEQPRAAFLYRKHGFKLTEEKPSTAFGKSLKEQRYDLVL